MKLDKQTAGPKDFKAIRTGVLLMLILGSVVFVRTRLLDLPMERDEGEFAYGAQMLLQGLSPYKHACNVMLKPPGTCVAYALAMGLFGETTAAIHLEVILITLGTALLVFFLTRRICGDNAGLVAAATYALLSINPPTLGMAAHATNYVMLPALAGVFLLQPLGDDSSLMRIFWAGLLIGLATLMKQTGAAFGPFAIVWVIRCELCSPAQSLARLARRLGVLGAGGLLPLAVTCCIVTLSGDWDRFIFWTFTYAGVHSQTLTFIEGMEEACRTAVILFKGAPGLWSLVLIGPFLLWWGRSLDRWRFFVLSFLFFSFLAAYPGWRQHYFIQLFPAAALLVGAAFHEMAALSERFRTRQIVVRISAAVFVVACVITVIQWKEIYFQDTPAQVSRSLYGLNPFPEAVELGGYLAEHCSKNGTIAVLGSEPEIFVYSHRRAATSFACTYPLMETHKYALAMQKRMINEIEQNNPEYVVFVSVPTSWLQRPESSTLIFDWFKEYRHARLQMVGYVEILPGESVYHWLNENDPPAHTSAEFWLAIYKRRSIPNPRVAGGN